MAVLVAMLDEAPLLWIDSNEQELHVSLLKVALEAPKPACCAAVLRYCTPLQAQLLPLMMACLGREEFLPVICEYGVFTPEELDEHGQTLLHRLCEMAEAQDSEEGGGEGGEEEGGLPAGAAMLDALLTTRPDVHLFAPNKSGLTALCWAKSTSDCARMLFHATLRALSRSTVSIVFSRRDGHLFSDYAHHLSEEIETAFPGLTAAITPMFDMKPGEEGCNGSFEVLWEGDGWMRTKLLGSRLATGKLPLLPNILLSILQHLLGPAAPQEALANLQEALLAHGAVLRGVVAVPRSISTNLL